MTFNTFDPTDPRAIYRLLLLDIDKPHRVRALHQLAQTWPMEPVRYWDALRMVWTGSESLYREDWDVLRDLWNMKEHPGHFMTLAERQALRALPNGVMVYRGGTQANWLGWSWTLDRPTAVWFANRCPIDGQPLVVEACVPNVAILAYNRDRKEEEIIIDPASIPMIPAGYVIHHLPEREPEPGAMLAQLVQAGTWDPSGAQGLALMLVSRPDVEEAQAARVARLHDAGLEWLADEEQTRLDRATVLAQELGPRVRDALRPPPDEFA